MHLNANWNIDALKHPGRRDMAEFFGFDFVEAAAVDAPLSGLDFASLSWRTGQPSAHNILSMNNIIVVVY